MDKTDFGPRVVKYHWYANQRKEEMHFLTDSVSIFQKLYSRYGWIYILREKNLSKKYHLDKMGNYKNSFSDLSS